MSENRNFSLELHATPLLKSGRWGKKNSNYVENGFTTFEEAKDAIRKCTQKAIKRSSQKSNTYFVEVFILNDGNYVDCDSSIVTCNKSRTKFNYGSVAA